MSENIFKSDTGSVDNAPMSSVVVELDVNIIRFCPRLVVFNYKM